MGLQYSELDNNIRLMKLTGKLDVVGTGEIETKFAGHCTGDNVLVVVDLSDVDFFASIGIRLLTLNARLVVRRSGRMALLNPTSKVHNVLEMTGIHSVVPVYLQYESAEAVLLGA